MSKQAFIALHKGEKVGVYDRNDAQAELSNSDEFWSVLSKFLVEPSAANALALYDISYEVSELLTYEAAEQQLRINQAEPDDEGG